MRSARRNGGFRIKEWHMNDPMETLIANALDVAGIPYDREVDGLDFRLRDIDVFIEVKQFHSSRIAQQMSRRDNIIVAQGRKAVEILADFIKSRER
jgi:hypothetical protein